MISLSVVIIGLGARRQPGPFFPLVVHSGYFGSSLLLAGQAGGWNTFFSRLFSLFLPFWRVAGALFLRCQTLPTHHNRPALTAHSPQFYGVITELNICFWCLADGVDIGNRPTLLSFRAPFCASPGPRPRPDNRREAWPGPAFCIGKQSLDFKVS